MINKFSWKSLFSEDFQSREIDTDELEEMIRDAVAKDSEKSIEDLIYTEDGVKVILDDGEIIEIEVDWNEIILV